MLLVIDSDWLTIPGALKTALAAGQLHDDMRRAGLLLDAAFVNEAAEAVERLEAQKKKGRKL